MRIGYLGTGVWGFCLASLLSGKGHEVVSWGIEEDLVHHLNDTREHPKLKGAKAEGNIHFTIDLEEALQDIDYLVESVTARGVRPVFEQVKGKGVECPIVSTSKGIEQKTGLTASAVIMEVMGPDIKSRLSCISGPSFASEVVYKLPASVVCASYDPSVMMNVAEVFSTPYFRVYPNSDMRGVSLCGALKNVIAIACGVCDGLELGQSAKAALMTRGLHEIAKFVVAQGGDVETVYGLAGMGDLCLTCSSTVSRNHHFGYLIAQGISPEDAKEKIGMITEGVYTAVSALEISKRLKISMPITEAIYNIIYGNLKAKDAVFGLMSRVIKEERL